MPDILVRGVSQEAVAALKARAKAEGTSLSALARAAIESDAKRTRKRAALDRIATLRAGLKGKWKGPTVLEMLREERDRHG